MVEVKNFAESQEERAGKKIDVAMKLRERFLQERSFGLEVGAKSLATVISEKIPEDLKELKVADCRKLLKEIKDMCEVIRPKSETMEELEKTKQELIKQLDPDIAQKVFNKINKTEEEKKKHGTEV